MPFWHQKPTFKDFFILAGFVIAITLQPYFLRSEINTYELSLYQPGIDVVLKGGIPFRDIIHLRGPLELY